MIQKLIILILSIFLVLCAGSCNVYPIYLEKLMKRFNFTLTEVNLFGTCANMGLWVAFPMGFIYDKFGPRISCFLSLIMLSTCYTLLNYIMHNDYFIGMSIYPLLGIAFLMGQGSILLYTSCLATNLKNFRFKGNTVLIALLIANMAVSPSVLTTYRQNLKMTYEYFFFYLSIFIFGVILVSLLFMEILGQAYSSDEKIKRYQKFKEERILRIMLGFNIVVVGVYVFAILFNFFKEKNIIPIVVIYPAMLLMNFIVLFLEIFKVFDYYYYKEFQIKPTELQNLSSENMNASRLESSMISVALPKIFLSSDRNSSIILTKSNKDFSPLRAMKTKKFVLIFIMLLLGMGSVIANLNNIQFIVRSAQNEKNPLNPINTDSKLVMYFDKKLFLYLILYFIFNSSTRMVSGFILGSLIKIKKFYHYILFFSFVGLLSQSLGILMDKNVLFVSISLAGSTHGGYVTFANTFVKNEFGLNNMGKNLGLLTIGAALGSLLISDYIFIYSYDYFSSQHSGDCRGKECFYPSYIITSIFFLINIILSYILVKDNEKKNILEIK